MSASKGEKYNDILKEALEEFASNSFENASLNNIIKKSKTSKGTFYYHFKDKDDLYIHLIKESIDVKWNYINEILENNEEQINYSDIFSIFKQQAEVGMKFAFKYPLYYKLAKKLSLEKGKPIYDKVTEELQLDSQSILNNLINISYDNEVFDEIYDKEFIFNIINHHFQNFDEILKDDDLDKSLENINKLINFLKNGLGRK